MEFEVADIKPVAPDARPTGPVQFGVSPGGRVNLPGQILPLRAVIALAWNLPGNANGPIIGAPKWLGTARFDIVAKLPSDLVLPTAQAAAGVGTGTAGVADRALQDEGHFEGRSRGRVYARLQSSETHESRPGLPNRMQGASKHRLRDQPVQRAATRVNCRTYPRWRSSWSSCGRWPSSCPRLSGHGCDGARRCVGLRCRSYHRPAAVLGSHRWRTWALPPGGRCGRRLHPIRSAVGCRCSMPSRNSSG